MKIGIISTGDELLRGALVDTNGPWIAGHLYALGYTVSSVRVVGDRLDNLTAAFAEALAQNDLTVVTGGLGPTVDDLSAQAVTAALGVPLERNETAAAQIEATFSRLRREMNPINLKQADLPQGAEVLQNPVGTAPGFRVKGQGGEAYFFPGVPAELEAMCEKHLFERLPPKTHPHRAFFKCFGFGESNMQALLKEQCSQYSKLHISFRASFPEILLTISGPDQIVINNATAEIRALLKNSIFAEEAISLPEALGRELVARRQTLASAESCTGGLIGHAITEVAGSSAYFRGGIIAYDNDIKLDVLLVSKEDLVAEGAVSEAVVCQMAEGARRVTGADIGVATSGIAGPDGGTTEKPVGLVHMAVANSHGVRHKKRVFEGYSRSRVKKAAAWTVMHMALAALTEKS